MVDSLPFSSVTTIRFCAASKRIVVVLPVLMSRTINVPVPSSVETTSTSLFIVAAILAAAYTGFFESSALSNPDSFALCSRK